MRGAIRASLVLVLAAGSLGAAEPQAKPVLDVWNAAYLGGGKAGYVHTWTEEVVRDGQKQLRTTVDFNLTVRRFNDTAQMRVETGTEETPEGKVTRVFMTQHLGKRQALVLVGTVVGNRLHYVVR